MSHTGASASRTRDAAATAGETWLGDVTRRSGDGAAAVSDGSRRNARRMRVLLTGGGGRARRAVNWTHILPEQGTTSERYRAVRGAHCAEKLGRVSVHRVKPLEARPGNGWKCSKKSKTFLCLFIFFKRKIKRYFFKFFSFWNKKAVFLKSDYFLILIYIMFREFHNAWPSPVH